MFSALNYGASARLRFENATNDLQKLFEIPTTTIEELLSFPNVISELQTAINTHGFFTNDKIESLICFVFEQAALRKYSFDEGRKYAYLSSELLSAKIPAISEFFFHKENVGYPRKSGKVDELDFENDFDVGKDLLLSPVNSVKSKSANFVETCNKNAIGLLLAKALKHSQMDEIRAGYLSKILIVFFQKNKNEFLNFFYKSSNEYLRFLQFLEFYSISDFLNNVVLYESSLNNDSMVFQESQTQIGSEYATWKVDFFAQIITHESFKGSFEVASNVKTLIESFFSKYKNLAEADEFMIEIFVKYNYFRFLRNLLAEVRDQSVVYEILCILRIFSNFLVFVSNSKVEILSDQIKNLFIKENSVFVELGQLLEILKGLLEKHKKNETWTNSFKQSSQCPNLKIEICLLDIFTNLLKQQFLLVHDIFLNQRFLVSVLVS